MTSELCRAIPDGAGERDLRTYLLAMCRLGSALDGKGAGARHATRPYATLHRSTSPRAPAPGCQACVAISA